MSEQKLIIGLFGFGVVGEGIYQVLSRKSNLNASIKKVCVKNSNKPRNAPADLFTTDADELLYDPEINVVVELIDDADAALDIVLKAFHHGKSVVSANKKLIAHNLPVLLACSMQRQVNFLYEAAVCGSIPIIRNLEEYYDNDLLKSITGIVNGSTNYILTKMKEEQSSFPDALQQAQELGFAESNPHLDVAGLDAANKLSILLKHAYDLDLHPSRIPHLGIERIDSSDLRFAQEKGCALKLLAHCEMLGNGEVVAYVLPSFVPPHSRLYSVNNEYNGLLLGTQLADEQFLYGKGAGRFPTSSAVLSDIAALRYNYRYEYRKSLQAKSPRLSQSALLKVFVGFPSHRTCLEKLEEPYEETHWGRDRNYVLAKVRFADLAALLSDPELSVIECSALPGHAIEDQVEMLEEMQAPY